MKTYILIILFQSGYTGVPMETINAEFNSFESCEIARKFILKSAIEKKLFVRAQGCFQK